jgi:hypothetical protein
VNEGENILWWWPLRWGRWYLSPVNFEEVFRVLE